MRGTYLNVKDAAGIRGCCGRDKNLCPYWADILIIVMLSSWLPVRMLERLQIKCLQSYLAKGRRGSSLDHLGQPTSDCASLQQYGHCIKDHSLITHTSEIRTFPLIRKSTVSSLRGPAVSLFCVGPDMSWSQRKRWHPISWWNHFYSLMQGQSDLESWNSNTRLPFCLDQV